MSDHLKFLNSDNPIEIFNDWYAQAQKVEENPGAFTFSTLGLDGFPNSRTLLLKSFEDGEYGFFSNYLSEKAKEIEECNKAAISFYWHNSGRQVRIKGNVVKCSREESREYFLSRANESQAASACSIQSEVISSRDELEKNYKNLLERKLNGEDIFPDHWGGYILKPVEMIFFIYGDHRLNDRFKFSLNNDGMWECKRLQP